MSQDHPTYLARKAKLEKDRCDRCAGLGQLDDAEPGDAYFNQWRCPECKGTGLKSSADETTAGVPVHYGSGGKLHLGEGPDGRRPPEKAGERPRVQPPKFCAVDGCYNRVADHQEVCDSCSQKAADGPGEEDGPWAEGWDKRSGRCICEHHDRYHFDDGTGFVRCRATADCNCKWPTSAQKASGEPDKCPECGWFKGLHNAGCSRMNEGRAAAEVPR